MIKSTTLTSLAITISILLWSTETSKAQVITKLSIDSAYTMARLNYPLIAQVSLLEKSESYTIENISKGIWPQLSINGQATYQSDVTSISLPIPGATPNPISKDQYKLYGEVIQPLTDIITVGHQKKLAQTNAEIERQKTEVEFYKLKERVNQLYFGIILLDAQHEQVLILQKDLVNAIKKTEVAVQNGVAIPGSTDVLNAELLNVKQRLIELKAARKTYITMLSSFIGKELDNTTEFEKPIEKLLSATINRPELSVFESQLAAIGIQNSLITTKITPRVSLFLQSGVGRPALNMLNNDMDFYYIGGLRLNWNISSFYTSGNERKLVAVQEGLLNTQKDVFLFNIDLQAKQYLGEIQKLDELISSDKEIIALRERIKKTSSTQLENGTITSTEFLSLVNAEDQAKQNLQIHQIQLLMTQYNYGITTGN